MIVTEGDDPPPMLGAHYGPAVSDVGHVANTVDDHHHNRTAAAFIGRISGLSQLFKLALCSGEPIF